MYAIEHHGGEGAAEHLDAAECRGPKRFAVKGAVQCHEAPPLRTAVLRPILQGKLHRNLHRGRSVIAEEDARQAARAPPRRARRRAGQPGSWVTPARDVWASVFAWRVSASKRRGWPCPRSAVHQDEFPSRNERAVRVEQARARARWRSPAGRHRRRRLASACTDATGGACRARRCVCDRTASVGHASLGLGSECGGSSLGDPTGSTTVTVVPWPTTLCILSEPP